jgi:hypothetical protein
VSDMQLCADRLGKAMSLKPSMHAGRESDDHVVPAKCSNKDGNPLAEGAEGRRSAGSLSGHRWLQTPRRSRTTSVETRSRRRSATL